jgi:hypothetical protein
VVIFSFVLLFLRLLRLEHVVAVLIDVGLLGILARTLEQGLALLPSPRILIVVSAAAGVLEALANLVGQPRLVHLQIPLRKCKHKQNRRRTYVEM